MSSGNRHENNYDRGDLSPTSKTRLPPSGYDPESQPSARNRFHQGTEAKGFGNPRQAHTQHNTHKVKFTFPKENMKRIDYVLVYQNKTLDELKPDSSDYKSLQKKLEMRKKFEDAMKEETIQTQTDVIGEEVFVKIHTPLKRLCQEAENMNLEMPLLGMENYTDEPPTCCYALEEKYLKTDDEVDFVSAPFEVDQIHKFEDNDDADKFFRPALRCLLTHHILINIDIRNDQQEEEDPFAKKGLPYLKMKRVYVDGFILHDETLNDPALQEDRDAYRARLGSQFLLNEADKLPKTPSHIKDDPRDELNRTWAKRWFKYQPLWKIRNYFGEKIGLYFAWSGTLVMSLWIPTILGLAIFIYGLTLSVKNQISSSSNSTANATFLTEVTQTVEDSINVIKESFDNEATPYFALIICLWGTIFLEVWKRKNYTLAYEWDVNSFEDAEPDRPEFFGTKSRPNPVIPDELEWIYPIYRQIAKYFGSFMVLIVMVICVFICAAAVVLYRVYMTVDFCTAGMSAPVCLVVSVIASSLLQAITIMILGKIYDKLAVVLTNWENHRTQTQFDDALIIKMFAFQFANSYTSLFYIAFFRGIVYTNGIFGLGPQYQDSCGTSGNCMAMLSLQVLVLMVVKPVPRFLKDVILPFVKRIWRLKLRPCFAKCCKCSRCCARVEPKPLQDAVQEEINTYMARERQKPQLNDFTLLEYTEKVIVYGFLMLFSASLPLAPLIALLVNWLDVRIDARRMLWWYRRPVAYIAQDIGMWYGILQFLNMAGVVTNGFLIAFTSAWGSKYTLSEKLWIVIGFEHIVFAVKFIIAAIIPDIPARIQLAMKREKYQVGKIMAKGKDEFHSGKSAKSGVHASHFGSQLGALPPMECAGSDGKGAQLQAADPPIYEATAYNTEGTDESRRKHRRKHKKQRKTDDGTHTGSSSSMFSSENTLSSLDFPSNQLWPVPWPRDVQTPASSPIPSQPAVYLSPDDSLKNCADLDGTGYSTGQPEDVDTDYLPEPHQQQSGIYAPQKLKPLPSRRYRDLSSVVNDTLHNTSTTTNPDISSAQKAKRMLAAKYGNMKYTANGDSYFGFGEDSFPVNSSNTQDNVYTAKDNQGEILEPTEATPVNYSDSSTYM